MMTEDFLAVQWLRLHTSKARGMGLIPGRGTKFSGVTQHCHKIKSQLKKKMTERLLKTTSIRLSQYKGRDLWGRCWAGTGGAPGNFLGWSMSPLQLLFGAVITFVHSCQNLWK